MLVLFIRVVHLKKSKYFQKEFCGVFFFQSLKMKFPWNSGLLFKYPIATLCSTKWQAWDYRAGRDYRAGGSGSKVYVLYHYWVFLLCATSPFTISSLKTNQSVNVCLSIGCQAHIQLLLFPGGAMLYAPCKPLGLPLLSTFRRISLLFLKTSSGKAVSDLPSSLPRSTVFWKPFSHQ